MIVFNFSYEKFQVYTSVEISITNFRVAYSPISVTINLLPILFYILMSPQFFLPEGLLEQIPDIIHPEVLLFASLEVII